LLQRNTIKEWLIDSGASAHFTYDIRDFVDYEELKEEVFVTTANSRAQVIGKGTIIIVLSTEDIIRISPVYYISTLISQLLSMGTFFRTVYLYWKRNSIRIMKGSKSFLTFT